MDFKFPHTPHLAWLGTGSARADKVMSPDEVAVFLNRPVTVEEKIDGANLGIAFPEGGSAVVKNRGTVLSRGSHPQFQTLWPWLATHEQDLREGLGQHLTLYGEWCFAVHSVRYSALPDYFIGFDVYDRKKEKFWTVKRRNAWAEPLGVVTAPIVASGRYSLQELKQLLGSLQSRFGGEKAEGLYLRQDDGEWLRRRAKLVRPEFVQAIGEHWTKHALEKNFLSRVTA